MLFRSLLHSIVESIPFDVFALDMEDRYTLQNSTCKAHWGDVIGKHPREIAPDKEILGRWLSNNQRASSGKIVDEVVHYPVGDSVQHLRNIISPIWDKGSITGIVGVNIDVTDATLAHAELERKESLYRAIVDSFPDPIILCNPSGLLITINLPASRALGYPYPMNAAKEAIQCTDIFLCDDPSGIENTIEEVFRSRKLKTMECRLRKRDGSDILSNVESLPLYTREGDPLAILNIFRFQKSNSA